jgi:hypothetical protein
VAMKLYKSLIIELHSGLLNTEIKCSNLSDYFFRKFAFFFQLLVIATLKNKMIFGVLDFKDFLLWANFHQEKKKKLEGRTFNFHHLHGIDIILLYGLNLGT